MYVDDMLIVGNEESIKNLSRELEKVFNITVEEEMTDYLGCEFKTDKEGNKAWLGQANVVKSLKDKFGYLVEELKFPKTPGTTGLSVVKPEETDLISEEDQTLYRSGTGILLYLTKHSRPDISSPTRELSKVMDGASKMHMKELLRIIKFVMMTPDMGLKFKPKNKNGTWQLRALSDSDFASDKDSRRSVTGFVVYFLGVPIS